MVTSILIIMCFLTSCLSEIDVSLSNKTEKVNNFTGDKWYQISRGVGQSSTTKSTPIKFNVKVSHSSIKLNAKSFREDGTSSGLQLSVLKIGIDEFEVTVTGSLSVGNVKLSLKDDSLINKSIDHEVEVLPIARNATLLKSFNKLFKKSNVKIFHTFSDDSYLFFYDNDSLYSLETASSEIKKLSKRPIAFLAQEIDGNLFYQVLDASYGHELWSSDGTIMGTKRILGAKQGAFTLDQVSSSGASGNNIIKKTTDNLILLSDTKSDITKLIKLKRSDLSLVGIFDLNCDRHYWLKVIGVTNNHVMFECEDITTDNNTIKSFDVLNESYHDFISSLNIGRVYIGNDNAKSIKTLDDGRLLFFAENESTNRTNMYISDGTIAGTVRDTNFSDNENANSSGLFTFGNGDIGYFRFISNEARELYLLDQDLMVFNLEFALDSTYSVLDIEDNSTHYLFTARNSSEEIAGTIRKSDYHINEFFRFTDPYSYTGNVFTTYTSFSSERKILSYFPTYADSAIDNGRVNEVLTYSGLSDFRFEDASTNEIFVKYYYDFPGAELIITKEKSTTLPKLMRKRPGGYYEEVVGDYKRPEGITLIGNKIYFSADNKTSSGELWKYDLVSEEVTKVIQLSNENTGLAHSKFKLYGGELFFSLMDEYNSVNFWEVSGTIANKLADSQFLTTECDFGTSYLVCSNPTISGLWKLNFSDKAVSYHDFKLNGIGGYAENYGYDFDKWWDWREVHVDGDMTYLNIATTSLTTPYSFDGTNFVNLAPSGFKLDWDGHINKGDSGNVLITNYWDGAIITDGTVAGTIPIYNSMVGHDADYADFHAGLYYLNAAYGARIYVSDGSEAGTFELIDIDPGSLYGDNIELIGAAPNSSYMFVGNNGVIGNELWITDGTTPGTVILKDFNPAGGSSVEFVGALSNYSVLSVDDGTNDAIWITDGTTIGTTKLYDHATSSRYDIFIHNDIMYLTVEDQNTNDLGLYSVNGVTGAFSKLIDLERSIYYYYLIDGVVHFINYQTGTGDELWKTDNTSVGTMLVAETIDGPDSLLLGIDPDFQKIGSRLYFWGNDENLLNSIWYIDL